MSYIDYQTRDYDKLLQYIIRHGYSDYLYIAPDIKTQIYLNPERKIFTIDSDDFVKVDTFLVENGIDSNFYEDTWYYIGLFIEENNVEAIDYLIDTDFHCADVTRSDILDFLLNACRTACSDIIMALISYIDWDNLEGVYCLSEAFGIRDEDIVRLLLDNIPGKHVAYQDYASEAIEHGRLQNLKLIEEKYPEVNILEYLGLAIENGHIELIEYIVSKGANLVEFLRHNFREITISAINDHMDVIEYILDIVELDEYVLNEFLQRAHLCSPEYVDLLMDAGADFVKYGEELYRYALLYENHKLAGYLKENYL